MEKTFETPRGRALCTCRTRSASWPSRPAGRPRPWCGSKPTRQGPRSSSSGRSSSAASGGPPHGGGEGPQAGDRWPLHPAQRGDGAGRPARGQRRDGHRGVGRRRGHRADRRRRTSRRRAGTCRPTTSRPTSLPGRPAVDFTVGAVGGDLKVQTASGDLRCSSVAGRAVFTTASGDIEVGAAAGQVEVKATSGDVRLGELAHGARVTNVSGDVRVLAIDEGRLHVRSVSGNVVVGVVTRGGPARRRRDDVGRDALGHPAGRQAGIGAARTRGSS